MTRPGRSVLTEILGQFFRVGSNPASGSISTQFVFSSNKIERRSSLVYTLLSTQVRRSSIRVSYYIDARFQATATPFVLKPGCCFQISGHASLLLPLGPGGRRNPWSLPNRRRSSLPRHAALQRCCLEAGTAAPADPWQADSPHACSAGALATHARCGLWRAMPGRAVGRHRSPAAACRRRPARARRDPQAGAATSPRPLEEARAPPMQPPRPGGSRAPRPGGSPAPLVLPPPPPPEARYRMQPRTRLGMRRPVILFGMRR